MKQSHIYLCFLSLFLVSSRSAWAQLDLNGNQQSDIWERVYDARDLLPGADADKDGYTNREESIAGTDPFDPASFLKVDFSMSAEGQIVLSCPQPNHKRYDIYHREDLSTGDWTLIESMTTYEPFHFADDADLAQGFYRVDVNDADSDSDGVSDWDELKLGFDPDNAHTGYFYQNDQQRIANALPQSNLVTLHLLDGQAYENWPDSVGIVIRRSGGIDPITVTLSYTGTADSADFIHLPTQLSLPAGMSDTHLQITPIDDATSEAVETLTVTLLDGSDYDLGSAITGTITLHDADSGVSEKEAGRLLAQASFGATPGEIAEVQSSGIEAWIDDQIALAPSLLQDATEAADAIDQADENVNFYGGSKLVGWWENAIHAEDQLRQRVAFALNQIIVVSDDAGMIDGQPRGMANFYDIFVRHAFGNFRDILDEVTYHPVMGIYLSHKGNWAPDPSIGRFPDENYAREIMQLFSIGLWMLNVDGSRILDANDQPIPTYTNFEISELARVFTGMNWGTNDATSPWSYNSYPSESLIDPYTVPMQFWEGRGQDPETGEWLPYQRSGNTYFIRDHGEKHLANGVIVPAGQLGTEDIAIALDGLFNHPNVGPFIARRLIQRLVKSNPSPAYIARVATTFNDDGTGTRGNMAAVIKAILMDDEARSFAQMNTPTAGKQREPYLRYVHFARAFDVASTVGPIVAFWNEDVFQQMPLSAPSVFNYYTPDYAPPGSLQALDLVAPEFQITTTVSAMTVPNEFYWMSRYGIISWYDNEAGNYQPRLDYTEELALADDPDALLRHLDPLLTYSSLSPQQQSLIRFALQRRIDQNRSDQEIVALAIYLIMTSPDYVIQK